MTRVLYGLAAVAALAGGAATFLYQGPPDAGELHRLIDKLLAPA